MISFRKCPGCLHRCGRQQAHDLEWPWSLGVFVRGLLHVRKTFKLVPASGILPEHGIFDGGILLHAFKKGEIGVHTHLIVGKGGSDRDLGYVGWNM